MNLLHSIHFRNVNRQLRHLLNIISINSISTKGLPWRITPLHFTFKTKECTPQNPHVSTKNNKQDLICGQYSIECKTCLWSRSSLGHCSEGHYFRVLCISPSLTAPAPNPATLHVRARFSWKRNPVRPLLDYPPQSFLLPSGNSSTSRFVSQSIPHHPTPLPKTPANWASWTFPGQCPSLDHG